MASSTAARALLSVSSVSGLGHSSSSISENVDLQVVEEIIERAPRSATSFPLVYRAYADVLDEHGLTASNDTVYYQFLLKLGVIRAPTWGEKWDLYKATHTNSSPSRGTLHSRRTSADNRTRAKIPFLSSASSDLDYGFQDGPDDDSETEGDLSALRYPQPRQHLVGYPATPSMDYDALTLSTPYRTSTPINSREESYSHIVTSPPLPPYSVSDVSESLLPDDSLSQRDRNESLDTPKGRYIDLDIDEDKWNARQEADMVVKADAFYRTGLLGRCWDAWHQAHRWVKDTTDQIDNVRSTILLRQTLQHWHAAYDRSLNMAATADQHRRMAEQATTLKIWMEKLRTQNLIRREQEFIETREIRSIEQNFKVWRTALNERRTSKWEKDMAKREKAFIRTRDARMRDEAWQTWYGRMRTTVDWATADKFHRRKTMRRTLHMWLKRTVLERQVNRLLTGQEEGILLRSFQNWHQKALFASRERTIKDRAERVVVRRIWSQWRLQLWRSEKSRAFDDRRVLSEAFAHLLSRHRKLQNQQGQAATVGDRSLMRRAMTVWMQAERSRLYTRVRDDRTKERILAVWQGRLNRLQRDKELALRFNDNLDRSNLRQSLHHWRTALQLRRTQVDIALGMVDDLKRKRLRSALRQWTGASQKIQADTLQADKARAFFRQRQALKVWKTAFVKRREQRAAEMARLDTLRGAMDVWRRAAQQAQDDRRRVAGFRHHRGKGVLRKAFDHWTARVVTLKTREQAVMATRSVALKRDALSRWRGAASRVRDLKTLLASSIEVHNEDLVRDAFVLWKDKAIRARMLRQQAERSMLDRDRKTLQDAFIAWRGALRERRLQPVQERVEEIVEDGLMFAVWDRWVSRSKKLPTIAFEKRRTVKTAFGRWRFALATRRKEQSISIPQDHRLLAVVLDIWRDKAAAKLAASTKRRRGRLRIQIQEGPRRSSSDAAASLPIRSLPSTRRVSVEQPTPGNRARLSSATSSDLVRQLRGTLDRR